MFQTLRNDSDTRRIEDKLHCFNFDVAAKNDKMTLVGRNIYFDAIPWYCFYNLYVLFDIMIGCASEHSHLIKYVRSWKKSLYKYKVQDLIIKFWN